MIPVQLACSVNCVKTVLDSVGQLSTLIVAIVGFITAMIVAKVTSGLELKRALCLKRVEAYELATRQLWQLITVYENILGSMAAINLDDDSSAIQEKIGLMLILFTQLGELTLKNSDLAQIMFYSDLPAHDVIQVSKEASKFVKVIKEIDAILRNPTTKENLELAESKIKNAINRLAPLIQQDLKHLYCYDDKLKKEIRQDKRVKHLFK